MEANPAVVTLRFNKFLPYWAVLQTDLRQTMRSWVYRLWVLMSVLAAAGFLLYRVGVHNEAGIFQSAATQCGELFRVMVVGSLALVVVLAVSAISSEKGTVADSVLSRGISRHQYFLAKWHARLVVVTATFALLAAGMLLARLLPVQGRRGIGSLAHRRSRGDPRGRGRSRGDRVVGRGDRRAHQRHRSRHHGVLARALRGRVPDDAAAGTVADRRTANSAGSSSSFADSSTKGSSRTSSSVQP